MMKQIFTGQLMSYAKDRNVIQQIWDGVPATFSLCIGAAVIWMALAVLFGYMSAVHAGKFTDEGGQAWAIARLIRPGDLGFEQLATPSTGSLLQDEMSDVQLNWRQVEDLMGVIRGERHARAMATGTRARLDQVHRSGRE